MSVNLFAILITNTLFVAVRKNLLSNQVYCCNSMLLVKIY